MQRSIRKKIFIVILLPALFLLFVIFLNYQGLLALGRSAELILANNYQSIKAAQQIRQHLETSRNEMLMAIFRQKNVDLKTIDSSDQVEGLLAVCRAHIVEAGEDLIVANLAAKFTAYRAAFAAPNSETAMVDFPQIITLTNDFLAELDKLELINEQGMERAEKRTRELAKRTVHYSVGLLLAAILCTLVLSSILSARLSGPVVRLAHTLASVREGRGEYPCVPVTTSDEIGFLSTEFNRLFERLKVYDRLNAEQLMAEKQKVWRAEKAKTQFIADLSHQLKTPMTSLSMSVGILTASAARLAPEKKAKLLDTAREDCARLSALVNELVDIARLDSMVKPRAKELLDLEQVIAGCMQPLQLQAEEKDVELEVKVEAGMPPLSIDSFRFPWVITNIVSNAIRHTDAGGRVTVTAHCRGKRCYVICSDTGAGIAPQSLPYIFERYTQFSEPDKMGTIGLGLAIVKDIIDEYGGEITVESELNHGTAFTLWVPLPTDSSHAKESSNH